MTNRVSFLESRGVWRKNSAVLEEGDEGTTAKVDESLLPRRQRQSLYSGHSPHLVLNSTNSDHDLQTVYGSLESPVPAIAIGPSNSLCVIFDAT